MRVHGAATDGKPVTAILAGADAESLTLTVKDRASPLVVPWNGVSGLAVSAPRTPRQGAVHGAKWGLAIGAVLGLLSMLGPPVDSTTPELELAISSPISGAITGATWGALRPGKRWRAVNVAEARASVAAFPTVAGPVADSVVIAAMTLPRAGSTPALEFTIGAGAPRSRHAQFPALGLQVAANLGWKPRLGAAVVGDALADLHHTAMLGGARVYARSAPLFADRGVLTIFGQVLAGKMRAEGSGVVYSTGGTAIQPGLGIDYGRAFLALRIQVDRTIVRDGLIYDEREPGGPVGKLTSTRVFCGTTVRLPPW